MCMGEGVDVNLCPYAHASLSIYTVTPFHVVITWTLAWSSLIIKRKKKKKSNKERLETLIVVITTHGLA